MRSLALSFAYSPRVSRDITEEDRDLVYLLLDGLAILSCFCFWDARALDFSFCDLRRFAFLISLWLMFRSLIPFLRFYLPSLFHLALILLVRRGQPPFCTCGFFVLFVSSRESVIQLVGFCVLGNEGGYPHSIRSCFEYYTILCMYMYIRLYVGFVAKFFGPREAHDACNRALEGNLYFTYYIIGKSRWNNYLLIITY